MQHRAENEIRHWLHLKLQKPQKEQNSWKDTISVSEFFYSKVNFILVILKRGSTDFDRMVQGVAEFGGRVITDILNFDIKTIKKGETIYCISNEETRSCKYLACLVAQIPVLKQKWVEDMIKQKKFIAPSTRKAYTLRDCSKYRPRLFKDTVMKLGTGSITGNVLF